MGLCPVCLPALRGRPYRYFSDLTVAECQGKTPLYSQRLTRSLVAWARRNDAGVSPRGSLGPIFGPARPTFGPLWPICGADAPPLGAGRPLRDLVSPPFGPARPKRGPVAPPLGPVRPLRDLVSPTFGPDAPSRGAGAPTNGPDRPKRGPDRELRRFRPPIGRAPRASSWAGPASPRAAPADPVAIVPEASRAPVDAWGEPARRTARPGSLLYARDLAAPTCGGPLLGPGWS
jgi:hypothetical protein